MSHQVPKVRAGSLWSPSISSLSAGYYYDLDDSCDDSDEEEVRAHLRCVAEQPPLKLDTSSEVQPALAVPWPHPITPGSSPSTGTGSQCCGTATVPSWLQGHKEVRDGDADGDWGEDKDGDGVRMETRMGKEWGWR